MIKAKFWYYIQNAGDGSCYPKFFKTLASAKEYASYDNERYCDDIEFKELEFDLEGNLLTPEPEIDNWRKEYGAAYKAEQEKREAELQEMYAALSKK